MSKELDEYRKLAGVKSLTERRSWALNEAPATFEVGDEVVAANNAGTESGKRGKVLTIDGGWAQFKTAKNEMIWLPNSKLSLADS
jgi:hypothetical protein